MPPTRGRRISRIRTPASKTGRGSTPGRHRHELGHQQPRKQPDAGFERRSQPPRRPVPLRGAAVDQRPGVAADAHRQNDCWRLADQRNDDLAAGYPIAISGASTGAALARPDRVEGAPLLLPEALWGWYDGRTQVTLPSGRIITPPNRTDSQVQPRRVRRARREDAERIDRGRPVPGTAMRHKPTTRSAPTRASISTSACAAGSRLRRPASSSAST